jgi:hypothetical protein
MKRSHALEIARSVLGDALSDDQLTAILWKMTYVFKTDEQLREALKAMKQEQSERLKAHEMHEALNTSIDNSDYERLQRENAELSQRLADIVAFTEWAKDTDISGEDFLTELRHPEQVTAKMVWDMATRQPLSPAAIAWGEKRLRELGLLDSEDTEGGA